MAVDLFQGMNKATFFEWPGLAGLTVGGGLF
jgi:hypothetical protein